MFYDLVKRLIDIVGATLGIILLSPIFIIVAVAIKLDSQGPILADIPQRVGSNGNIFKMYKFRSMIRNAHNLLRRDPKFKKLYEEYIKNSYKLEDDPRITKIGKFLRKTSVDELPQLVNVLKGEMSLVGPRAYYPDELETQTQRFPRTKQYISTLLAVKPGITGPWQVSGRSKIDFEQRVRMDASYAIKRSLMYDLRIMFRTIPAVFKGEGAQ